MDRFLRFYGARRLVVGGSAFLLVFFFSGAAAGDSPSFARRREAVIRIQPPGVAPPVGEILNYDVRWLGIPIGSGRVRLEPHPPVEGRAALLATAEAEGNGFLNAFYPVKDRLRSVLEADGFYTITAEKKLHEGSYRADERIDFDIGKRTARYESFLNGSKKEIPLEGPVHDVLGAFYWFRSREVEPGAVLRTVVNADEKNWQTDIRVVRAERLEIRKLGAFEVFLAELAPAFKGVLVSRGRAVVYFTADKHRVPILIKLRTPYGPVVGILEELPQVGIEIGEIGDRPHS